MYNRDGYQYSEANAWRDEYSSGEERGGSPVVRYIYKNAAGEPHLRVTRTSSKQFWQHHLEGKKWVRGAPEGPNIPYRLPELCAAAPDVPICICEGEKDADNVAALGLVATTNPGGAGKWVRELSPWLAGRSRVYIFEDNDPAEKKFAGQRHAREVAESLRGIVGEVRIISFAGLPGIKDVSDWIAKNPKARADELLTFAETIGKAPSKGYDLVGAEDVLIKNIDWLWHGHLVANTLELLAGVPGAGKSQIQASYVACVTTGIAWPAMARTGKAAAV